MANSYFRVLKNVWRYKNGGTTTGEWRITGRPWYYLPNNFPAIPSFRNLAIVDSNSSNVNYRHYSINIGIIPVRSS
jgi:hypothetical protein